MPAIAVKGAIIFVSVAVAAAIAVYESPQARQFAEDVRRRIAIALHALGDEINPANGNGEPRFNRPEDAEGFLQSQGAVSPGVEADAESARRQREELMYWNAIHLEKLARQQGGSEGEKRLEQTRSQSTGSNFEDFLHEDTTAAKGTTFVYNTGADVNQEQEGGLRNRASGVRGLQRDSVWVNPFGDEHNIDMDEQRAIDASLMSPDASEKYEVLSEGLYSANEDPQPVRATMAEMLVDTTVPDPPIMLPDMNEADWSSRHPHSEDAESAFASIHAWADNANNSFYSPLPTTPRALSPPPALQLATPASPTFSDPPISIPGSGIATPTDSMSLAGSGDEVWAPRSGATSDAGVMSVDGDGVSTHGTWTEVGSVVSEDDVAIH